MHKTMTADGALAACLSVRHWFERHCSQLVEVYLRVDLVVDLSHDRSARKTQCVKASSAASTAKAIPRQQLQQGSSQVAQSHSHVVASHNVEAESELLHTGLRLQTT